jgi:hypothetical protein
MKAQAAQAPADSYSYWRDALAGNFGPVHDSDPRCGFWRKRMFRGGPFVPVAIFEHEGEIVGLVDGKPADANEIWTFVCRYPVTEEAYRAKVAGEPWPDEDMNVTASLEAPSTIGANNPPQDEAEQLKAQIDAAAANAEVYKDIRDDDTAGKAQSARSRLLELAGDADKKHDKEKAPHLEAGRAVDKRWFPLRDTAKVAADTIRAALAAHERRKDAERAAVEAARLKAEREAEQARLKAEATGRPAPVPPPLPPVPSATAPATTIRGAYGRAASIKMVTVVTVTDQDAAYLYLKTNAEVIETIARAAKRAVAAGQTVPGTTVTQEKDIR